MNYYQAGFHLWPRGFVTLAENVGLFVPSVSNGNNTEDYVVSISSAESSVQISSHRAIVLSDENFCVIDDGYLSNRDQWNVEPG